MSSDNDTIPGAAEDSKGKEYKMAAHVEKMEGLMKNLSRLSLLFGFVITLGMVIVSAVAGRVRAEVIVLGMLIGVFMVSVAMAVNKSYGFGFRKLLPRRFPMLGAWLRVKSDEEVMTGMPRAYLVFSSIVLLVCSGSMTAGDIFISNLAYRKVPEYVKGLNFAFAGCTIIFVTSACLSLALATLTSKKHLKTMIASFFLASLAGSVASATLNFAFEGPYHYSSMEFSRRLMLKDLQGSYIKGQEYPSANISTWLIMKFAAAEIIMAFSCFNLLLAATFCVDFNVGIKKPSSILLGILGIIMLASGLALEIVLDLLITSDIMTSGYSWSLQYIRPIVAISTLLAGIHAFNGFYSAGNLRKFTLFFLSIVVIASTIFTGITVLRFRSEALEVEAVALSPCPSMNPDDTTSFCVYNTTKADQRRYERWNPDGNEGSLPPLACIPKEKLCDGKADLFIDKMDGNHWYSYKGDDFKYELFKLILIQYSSVHFDFLWQAPLLW